MDVAEALRRRRMVRSFLDAPVDPAVLDRVLHAGVRAPSAGNSQALDLVVLVGVTDTARYWDATLPPGRRASFPWPGLLRAPVLLVAVTDPDAYPARYAEADKAATGLGAGVAAWPVPYWWVDAGMAAENVLLAAVAAGLGACFFGLFGHEAAVLATLGVPAGRRAVGTIALGHPDPAGDRPSRSSRRPRRLDAALHRGGW